MVSLPEIWGCPTRVATELGSSLRVLGLINKIIEEWIQIESQGQFYQSLKEKPGWSRGEHKRGGRIGKDN